MSEFLNYRDGSLYFDDVSVTELAHDHGTPCYIYSRKAIEQQWLNYHQAFSQHSHLICYAVKANSNLAVLNILAGLGSGFDIVSGGELERVRAAGGDVSKVVFSGVGKSTEEMQQALRYGVKCFNLESVPELHRLNDVAASMQQQAAISLRVNPDVDANTHPYISTGLKENKFGIAFDDAHAAYREADKASHLHVVGIDCHIGSQITEISPFVDALERLLVLIDQLSADGIEIQHIDIGGGLGIQYEDESIPPMTDYAQAIDETLGDRDIEILMEPGRSIVGNAGILVTKVEYLKHGEEKNFAIVDAAMNDLLRPSLYSAYHHILPVKQQSEIDTQSYDVVGPICETGDFLGKSRALAIRENDLLAVCSAGAYGFTMASNYNSRPRVVELMINNGKAHVIRRRESLEELFQHESVLP